ncbi:adaptin N terminal region-domain-containing protein [Russula brevipes]|nr:adaptin N terminal region-domain-containing protein [Russula brevipes]
MSSINFNSWTENATRLGMRIQETLAERTKDFSLTGSGAGYYDTGEDKTKNIKAYLDSGGEREKLEAMKRLIAMISKGLVKNVAAPSLEVRKLVYIYLLRYAEAEPDLVLLSINTFQRDLADSSPLIRAMALRVLSGIHVPTIANLVVLAIKKCAADTSPYVRKTAALSIPKCYSLDESQLPSLIEILSTLLRDRSPLSIGSVATAFEAVCPTRLDLLHPHYRRLCRVLVDVDEWGQVNLLELLVRYARTMLPRPTASHDVGKEKEDVDPDLDLLLVSAEPLFQSRNPAVVMSVTRAFYYLALPSQHHKIVHPLLRLIAVSPEVERVVLTYILSISRTSPHLFSPHYTRFVVRADDSTQVKGTKTCLLRNLITVDNCQALLREFIDYTDDVDETLVAESIQGIGHIARTLPDSTTQCLNALMACIKSPHDCVVASAVVELKSLVQTQMQGATHAGPSSAPLTIVERLAYRIDEIRHPQARACIVWLVGQYAADDSPDAVVEGVVPWAPDVLRKIAKTFRDEIVPVKLQAVTLAAKLLVLSPAHATLTQLAKYIFALARYDGDYDVRDRGRMLQQLLAGVVPGVGAADAQDVGGVVLRRAQVRVVLFEGKEGGAAAPEERTAAAAAAAAARERLGTLGLVLGRDVPYARVLPDWLEHGVGAGLRHAPDDARPATPAAVTAIGHVAQQLPARAGGGGGGTGGRSTPIVVLTPAGSGGASPSGSVPTKAGWADLDKFYASESEEEEDEDEDEEREREESEGEGEEEEEEEDGEDDDDDDDDEGDRDGEEEDGDRSGDESDRQPGEQGDHEAGPLRSSEEEKEVDEVDGDVEEGSSTMAAPVR